MKNYWNRFAFAFAVFALVGSLTYCGGKSKDVKSDPAYVQGMDQLNKRDFEGAVATLKGLDERHPNDPEVKRKLMHALAGAAGFDAPNFRKSIKKMFDTDLAHDIGEEYRRFTEKARRDLQLDRRFRDSKQIEAEVKKLWKLAGQQQFVRTFNNWFNEAPELNTHQAMRLDEAIAVYEQLGFHYATSSKDDNFQWGSLYTYRLLANLKDVLRTLDDVANKRKVDKGMDLEKYFMLRYRRIVNDGFMAYKLFRHSYDRLRRVTDRFEEMLARVSGRRINARILSEARDTEEFMKDLFFENREMASELIARIEDRIDQDDFDGSLKRIFSDFREDSPEYLYRKARIKAIANIFIDDMKVRYAREYQEAESIVTQKFLDEAKAVYDQVVAQSSLTPAWNFYKDKKSELHRLIEAGEIIVREARDQDIDEQMRPHIKAMRERVDREQLRIVREQAKEARRDVKNMLVEERELLVHMEEYTKSRIDAKYRGGIRELEKGIDREVKPYETDYNSPDIGMDSEGGKVSPARKQRDKAIDYMNR